MQQRIPKHRDYDWAELTADAVIHGLALLLALGGVAYLVLRLEPFGDIAPAGPALIYSGALLAMFAISMVYNMMPASPRKWLLRRLDHSAIYLMIAGTYTPILVKLENAALALALGVIVWIGALVGIVLKMALPGRFHWIAVATYLALGWVGAFAASSLAAVLPGASLVLIFSGGLLYSAGVPFYLWEKLRFHNVIWHGFVVAAAACHYVAINLLYF